jgi:hypothetical protein
MVAVVLRLRVAESSSGYGKNSSEDRRLLLQRIVQ